VSVVCVGVFVWCLWICLCVCVCVSECVSCVCVGRVSV